MKGKWKSCALVVIISCLFITGVAYAEEQDNMTDPVEQSTTVENEPLQGWQTDQSGNQFYYNQDGTLYTGWKKEGNKWYYLDGDNIELPGIMIKDTVKLINDQLYYFEENGVMRSSGWISSEEGWYYADSNGALARGWKKIKNVWYYFDVDNGEHPGLMAENCEKVIAGSKYYFDASGAMKSGWLSYPEGWYYADNNGAQAIGWRRIKNIWYYFDGNNEEYPGLMISDCTIEIGGKPYIFNSTGAMREGWFYDGESWYYYDTSGQIVSGWYAVKGYWYYLNPADHKMVNNGWKLVDGQWYYFGNSGAMAKNWLSVGGRWYFLSGDGAMRTGWQKVGGIWYYLYKKGDSNGGPEGAMAKNCYIGGYYLGANGAMLSPEATRLVLRAQPYSSRTNYLILVDRASCRTTVFRGSAGAWNLVYDWQCAPGKPSTPTVSGQFTVGSKGYYFDSGNARCYWYTQFYGDYLFHSVLYSKYNGSLMDGRVGMQLSHGCVRLQIQNAKWIYNNIPTGTKVVVF